MSCSSHSPPLSHTGQSSGWLVSRNSSMYLRAWRHLRRFGAHHHAFGHRQRAAVMQLGHLLHFHQAHAAGGLQREALVIAERRNLDAHRFGGIDHQRSGRGLDRLPVDRQFYQISHLHRHHLVCVLVRARLAVQVLFELVPELLDDRDGRHRRRVAQRAEGPARACSSRGRRSARYRCACRRRRGTAAASCAARSCLRGRECTSRSFRARRTA